MERRDDQTAPEDKQMHSLSGAILQRPRNVEGRIEKGVAMLNQCDMICSLLPGFKDYFYIVERRGWHGQSTEMTSDIKLVDDLHTLQETWKRFPHAISLEYSNADFVDTDRFRPLGIPKPYAGIQISAWQEFKRHDLFVRGAALLPDSRFMKFGHFWNNSQAASVVKTERDLREETVSLAESIGARNIDFLFPDAVADADLPDSPDEINELINRAEMGILTTAGEGVNRFKMECLAADIPVLVPSDAHETTKKHINEHTGLQYPPTPEGLAEAISFVRAHPKRFSPRKYLLRHAGIHRAVKQLRKSLQKLSRREGGRQKFKDITWDGRNQSLIWGKEKCLDAFSVAMQEAGWKPGVQGSSVE